MGDSSNQVADLPHGDAFIDAYQRIMTVVTTLGGVEEPGNAAALDRIRELAAQVRAAKSRGTLEDQPDAQQWTREMYQLMMGRLRYVAGFIRQRQATYEAQVAALTSTDDTLRALTSQDSDTGRMHAILNEMLEELDALLAADDVSLGG